MDTLLHFKITETIGAGGMGVVYKALDTKLNRNVAIKALGKHLAHNPDFRKRFLIEAQAAAALNHPNIATIYETIEKDNDAFIVMEFIEGEEIGKKIKSENLSITQKLDYAIQIAEGLKEAHSKGIVHRDIKAANIMVTNGGRIKIMDFGLAKLAGSSMITQLGTTVGTINYMSPEQARGEEIDCRTDLWSLGILLYEMIAGKLPFKGDYEQAVIYSILNEEPKSVSYNMNNLPKELDEIVLKLLKKLPDERYQNAEEVLCDLNAVKQSIETGIPVELIKSKVSVAEYLNKSIAQNEIKPKNKKRLLIVSTSVLLILFTLLFAFKGKEVLNYFGIELVPSVKHLAVLPFELIGGNSNAQAFSAGLLETITSKLSQFEQYEGKLWVVPSSEIRRMKTTDITEAINRFGINMALTGSIQPMEKGYRITINLIDGETKRQLASRMIDDQFISSSTIQDEAIIKVADMLKIELNPQIEKAITAGNTKSPEAYEQYVIGKGLLAKAEKMEDLFNAKKYIEKSISMDSTFYPALVELSDVQLNLFVKTNDKIWIDSAIVNSEKALKLNENYLEGLIQQSNVFIKKGEYQKANELLQKILEKDAYNVSAYHLKATVLNFLGNKSDSELLYKRLIQLKPDYSEGYNSLAYFYFSNGKYANALEQYKNVIKILPNNSTIYLNLGSVYYYLNDINNAIEMYKKAISIEPDYQTYSNLATLYYRQGRFSEAARTYEKVIEIKKTDYRVWGNLAGAYYWTPGEKTKTKDACLKAISLAELQLKVNPNDTNILTNVASYYGMLGDVQKVSEILIRLEKLNIQNVQKFFSISILYEQWMNNRVKALEWMNKALEKGYPIQDVYKSPVLKDFVKDERFIRLINKSSQSSLTKNKL